VFHQIESWNPLPLRRALERSGFTQQGLLDLGLEGVAHKGRASGWVKSSLPPDTPISVLVRLFILGENVKADEGLSVFGAELGPLTALGLIQTGGGEISSSVQLAPLGDGWFASDFHRTHRDAPKDFVMGLSPATRLLNSITPRWKGARILELACGAGWLALDLRRSGHDVTATDISHRALEIARFNAHLNEISGIEWVQGSWFEPLIGRTFDVITCNPPHVPSPVSAHTYQDSDSGGENPCAHILRNIADYLEPGGIACIVMNWAHATEETWREAPLQWTPVNGLRRWLFHSKCHGPTEYAWQWIEADPAFETPDTAETELDRWVAHFKKSGIGAISSGMMFLQRCEAGGEWTRTDSRVPGELTAGCGSEILRLFANESWLRTEPTDQAILETRYDVPDGIEAEIGTKLGKTGWQEHTVRLTSPGRLCYDGPIDKTLMRLLEILKKGGHPLTIALELRSPSVDDTMNAEWKTAGLVRELARFALITPRLHKKAAHDMAD
jgi:methylase of polypeptide subunit release factors